jgi:hypothetical protein
MGDASSFQKKEARAQMPIFRYFTIVGSALLAFIFVCDAWYGDHEGSPRFNGSLSESAVYAPRPEQVAATREVRFTRDVTPAGRVREVFAQYVANEGRRAKRDATTVLLDDGKGQSHFSSALPERAVYAPRLAEATTKPAPSFTGDVTPAARVREAFAQFVPDQRWNLYSSAAMAIQ